MRLVIQRVKKASVEIEGSLYSSIGVGLLVFVGIEDSDSGEDASYLASKLSQLRIFADNEGKMNLDIKQVNGEILMVSQFTLHASTKKGNRPSFIRASRPEKAMPLYEQLLAETLELSGVNVVSGRFGANMKVTLVNDGPVTIIMDTKAHE